MSDHITRDDLRVLEGRVDPIYDLSRPVTDEEFDRIAREQGFVKRSECFDVWASTPFNAVRIELEAEDE